MSCFPNRVGPSWRRGVRCVIAAISLAGCGRVGVELLPTGLEAPPSDASDPQGPDAGSDAGDPDPGCEVRCENAHGSASCEGLQCVNTCSTGWADCDGDTSNGCEANVEDSTASCGSCSLSCTNANGSASCSAGVCAASCAPGFADCDGQPENGCESDLASNSHCGACDARCSNEHGSTRCEAGSCVPTCAAGFSDCDGDPRNGCETNVGSDPAHCGSCTRTCQAGAQVCVAGQCETSPCAAGRGECDGDLTQVCETTLATSPAHCGFCGNACSAQNGAAQCSAGACAIASCSSGYDDCDDSPSNGCEVQLSSNVNHCGACGASCTNAHGSTRCTSSACAPTCSSGWGDCDASRANGCERSLNAVDSCGACGRVCPANGGTPTCNAGVCGVSCNMTGTFALKLSVPVTWSETEALRGGSGTYTLWLRLQASHSGNSVTTTITQCNRSVPPLAATLVSEQYLYAYAASLFDEVGARMPTTSVTATLSGSAPGSSYNLPLAGLLMGTNLSDPLNATWPSRASGLTSVDHDMDGRPGVSASYVNGGGYVHPRAGTGFFDDRASTPYVAARTVFSLSGRVDSCTRSTGTAAIKFVDTRIFGCRMADGSQCTSGEADFLDRNCPNYRFGTSSYTMQKVADAATCADVQAALP